MFSVLPSEEVELKSPINIWIYSIDIVKTFGSAKAILNNVGISLAHNLFGDHYCTEWNEIVHYLTHSQ